MSLPIMPKSLPLRALAVALALAVVTAPALAQAQAPAPPENQQPGALARDAIDKLMRALSLAIENLPQYAMPELNENGDIVIRRINPRAEKPRPPRAGSPDETRT
jgi:hypothetical protein